MIEIKTPVFPESVSEGNVLSIKSEGKYVKKDEVIAEIETDKIVLEVSSPADGLVKKALKTEGDEVLSEEVLLEIDDKSAIPVSSPKQTEEKISSGIDDNKTENKVAESANKNIEANLDNSYDNLKVNPVAKSIAKEHNLDLNSIKGTGKDGRIIKEDVLNITKTKQNVAENQSINFDVSSINNEENQDFKRVPMTKLRKVIAQRLLSAQKNAAMLTTFNEVNMKQVMDLRKKYQDNFIKTHGVKLGFMSFFVKAVTESLKKFPNVNSFIDDDDILYFKNCHIGIAVSTDKGLVVPVIKNANHLNLAEIERSIKNYGEQAKNMTLNLDDLQGGTFTITNGGIFGSLLSTPILNPPQSAILGMHAIQERPVVIDGKVEIMPMMYLALSYDHRLLDGKDSVSFLISIKNILEDPTRMILEI